MIHVLSHFAPITLDEQTSIRMLEARLLDNISYSPVRLLLPTVMSLNGLVSLHDLLTDFARQDLNGTRLVIYGANHKILEVRRLNGKISSSREMDSDAFHMVYTDFCRSLESALWSIEHRFPGIFPTPCLAVEPELFARLLIETYTLEVQPRLSPVVHYSPNLVNYFREKYLVNLPWVRVDDNGRDEITKVANAYVYKETGERGYPGETFTSPDSLEFSRKFLDHFFGC
jgi:hypothetical protein